MNDLSGGQRGRVAIARATITNPMVVLAEEPTAALDAAATKVIHQEFVRLRGQGRALLIATHDPRVAAWCDRTITLIDGHMVN